MLGLNLSNSMTLWVQEADPCRQVAGPSWTRVGRSDNLFLYFLGEGGMMDGLKRAGDFFLLRFFYVFVFVGFLKLYPKHPKCYS